MATIAVMIMSLSFLLQVAALPVELSDATDNTKTLSGYFKSGETPSTSGNLKIIDADDDEILQAYKSLQLKTKELIESSSGVPDNIYMQKKMASRHGRDVSAKKDSLTSARSDTLNTLQLGKMVDELSRVVELQNGNQKLKEDVDSSSRDASSMKEQMMKLRTEVNRLREKVESLEFVEKTTTTASMLTKTDELNTEIERLEMLVMKLRESQKANVQQSSDMIDLATSTAVPLILSTDVIRAALKLTDEEMSQSERSLIVDTPPKRPAAAGGSADILDRLSKDLAKQQAKLDSLKSSQDISATPSTDNKQNSDGLQSSQEDKLSKLTRVVSDLIEVNQMAYYKLKHDIAAVSSRV